MVELLQERFHGPTDPRVVVEPSGERIDLSLHGNLNLEAMTVHLAALVPRGNLREGLCGFKCEVLREAYIHQLNPLLKAGMQCKPTPFRKPSDGWGCSLLLGFVRTLQVTVREITLQNQV